MKIARSLKNISFQTARVEDAQALASLHAAVAEHQTRTYGQLARSAKSSEKGVLFAMRNSHVVVAKSGAEIIATFYLATKKPWAIDRTYFTKCQRPLYLLSMAVAPAWQRCGVGTRCMAEAKRIALAWPANAIILDAFDSPDGAGPFYARCGYTEMGRVTYRNVPLIYYELLLG